MVCIVMTPPRLIASFAVPVVLCAMGLIIILRPNVQSSGIITHARVVDDIMCSFTYNYYVRDNEYNGVLETICSELVLGDIISMCYCSLVPAQHGKSCLGTNTVGFCLFVGGLVLGVMMLLVVLVIQTNAINVTNIQTTGTQDIPCTVVNVTDATRVALSKDSAGRFVVVEHCST